MKTMIYFFNLIICSTKLCENGYKIINLGRINHIHIKIQSLIFKIKIIITGKFFVIIRIIAIFQSYGNMIGIKLFF